MISREDQGEEGRRGSQKRRDNFTQILTGKFPILVKIQPPKAVTKVQKERRSVSRREGEKSASYRISLLFASKQGRPPKGTFLKRDRTRDGRKKR